MIDQGASPSYPFTYKFESGANVTVQAVPRLGYDFNGWSGDLSVAGNPATLVMNCNKTITANFSIDWLLIGSASVSLVAAVSLVSVLIIRRRADSSASKEAS